MSLLLVLLIVLAVALLTAAVVAVVRRDGYGTLEPPRSHPGDEVRGERTVPLSVRRPG